MKIQIENYYGNDIVIIDYCLRDKSEIKEDVLKDIEGIANEKGYNVADVEEGALIRVQQENVDNTEEEETKALIELIADLNNYLLNF